MKIGIIKETKTPTDSRAAISPQSVAKILDKCSEDTSIALEKSAKRCFDASEYKHLGVEVDKEDMSDCDVLFGVKEVNIDSLIPNKHYFFFGHIAKCQEYNRPLLKAMMEKKITFTDYEYLTDDAGKRVCAFGWYAGIVGAYNTLRLIGLRHSFKDIGPMRDFYHVDRLVSYTPALKALRNNILITGNGRASVGAQTVLKFLGYKEVPLNSDELANGFCYSVATLAHLVERIDGEPYDRNDFRAHPELYKSKFDLYTEKYDALIAAHKWEKGQPVYLSEKTLRDETNNVKVVGDITCDIKGSICTTIRPSTHKSPFYTVKLLKNKVVKCADDNKDGIAVTAVDNLPDAIAKSASMGFSSELEKVIIEHLIPNGIDDEMIARATIVKDGEITERYSYLNDFVNEK